MWERTDNQEVGLEAATLQRVRNSSLVKRARAENITGLSAAPKPRIDATLRGRVSGRGAFWSRYTADREDRYRAPEELMQA